MKIHISARPSWFVEPVCVEFFDNSTVNVLVIWFVLRNGDDSWMAFDLLTF